MAYLMLPGGNQPLIDLLPITPAPRSNGLQYTRRSFTAAGGQVLEGPFVELVFDVIESQAAYDALLTQFGLDGGTSEAVTITLPGDLYEDVRWNGNALRPVPGESVSRTSFFIRDVKIVIRDLVVAS